MLYSKELEEIIEAALADGEITEKERAVLHKRAKAEGIDPDELDVVIDGRLSKMKKVEKDWLRPAPPNIPDENKKSNSKFGIVEKCPNCGAVIEAGSVKCNECGYTFRGVEANSSRVKLSNILQEIEKRDFSSKSLLGKVFGSITEDSDRDKARARAINDFPIPSSKEDLLEFILFLQPHSKRSTINAPEGETETIKSYKRKYQECINKAKIFFADDPQFRDVLPQKKGLFGGLFGKK